ncbi:MAG: ABC transporter permease [Lachnospiraceae bacterium]
MKTVKHCLIAFISLLLIWQAAVTIGQINPALFPAPLDVCRAFGELFTSGLAGSTSHLPLLGHISISLIRFFIGYLLAAFFGIGIGLLLGTFPRVFEYINPILQLIRPIAPVAWMPFIVLWFGIGDVPAIVIIFIAGFFPILLSTVSAIANLDPIYTKISQNFGITKGKRMFKIILPAAFSQIINSLRLALGTAWIFLVSGEMIGAQSGLGFLVMDAKNCMRMDALMAVILTIGVFGLLLDTLIRLIEKEVA